jgi:peptidoglycan/xylan/chitin deacetylase (PgdA/CDA1 family)
MRYDVCISFEGTYRDYARKLANALKKEGIYTFFAAGRAASALPPARSGSPAID